MEEIVVVEKRLVLKEEIHIRRVHVTEEVEIPITLRKERVIVERPSDDEEKNALSDKDAAAKE